MERCNVVDEFGVRTGRVVIRGSSLAPGEYYPVVHIWIKDELGRYLVQQRALHLKYAPGVWAATVGYVWAGEESRAAAVREVQEELGLELPPALLRSLARMTYENLFEEVWLVEVSQNMLGEITLDPDVADTLWATKAELAERIRRGAFYGYSYFDDLPE